MGALAFLLTDKDGQGQTFLAAVASLIAVGTVFRTAPRTDPYVRSYWPRVHALEFEIGFGAGDEEAGGLMELEVEVTALHDIERARLGNQHIEDVDFMQFAGGDVDEARNRSTQVEQRVQFDWRFGGAKLGPWEQRQAQVD